MTKPTEMPANPFRHHSLSLDPCPSYLPPRLIHRDRLQFDSGGRLDIPLRECHGCILLSETACRFPARIDILGCFLSSRSAECS
jgi:hypothetical protein